MTETNAGARFESWTVPETEICIEYATSTLEEIRTYCLDGLRRISRGGMEVGGVLFGARGDNQVRILTWRPIQCEHAHGPAFVLSQNDRMELGAALQKAKADPELEGLHALGLFLSHPRGDVSLTDSDRKIFDHFFPWSWQIALVLRPTSDGAAQAGFFFRDSEGHVRQESSYREFTLAATQATPPALPAAVAERPADAVPAPMFSPRRFTPSPERSPSLFADRRVWIWAVPILLALIVGAMMLERPPDRGVPAIGLRVMDSGGDLKLLWDKGSPAVRDAIRATLDIKDGSTAVELPLSGERLRDGNFTYTRKTGDLEVRMTVYPVNGNPVQESTRFVGASAPSASNTEDAAQVRRERDNLEAEVERLRTLLRKQQGRNRELEETVRILENRVQVEQYRRPAPNSESIK